MPDSQGYLQIAENIVNHASFSRRENEPFIPDNIRTPVYPLFIALFKAFHLPVSVIIVFQTFLSSVTCSIVFLIIYELFKKIEANRIIPFAFAASLLIILDVPSAAFSGLIMSETLFTFLLLISFYFFTRQQMLLAGLFLGTAVLCRPLAFGLPVLWAACMVFQRSISFRKKIANSLIFLFMAYLVISFWALRNKLVFDEFFISKISSIVICYHHAAEVNAALNQTSVEYEQEILSQKVRQKLMPGYSPLTIRDSEKEMAWEIISSHPFIFLKNYLKGMFYLLIKPIRSYLDWQSGFNNQYSPVTEKISSSPASFFTSLSATTSAVTIALVFFQLILLAVLWVLFFSGLYVLSLHKQWLLFGYFILTVIYFCLLNAGSVTDARFRIPLMPFLSVAAAFGVDYLWKTFLRKIVPHLWLSLKN